MTFPLSGLVDVYTNQVPFESDVLRSSTYRMADVGQMLKTILGTGLSNTPLFVGLACAPVSPPGLQVVVGPGCAYNYQNYLPTAFSVLPADTNSNHNLYKQGILWDPVTLSTPAPISSGNSVIHLVEAIFQTQDVDITSRPYFNSADPTTPIFLSLSDTRIDTVVVQIKLGTEASSPTPPSPDAGYTGLYWITVTFGQTTIVSGNIATVTNAPFITESLTQKISSASVSANYVKITDLQQSTYAFFTGTGTANALTATVSPALASYISGDLVILNITGGTNTGAATLNLNGLGALPILVGNSSGGAQALSGGEIKNGSAYIFILNGSNFNLINPSVDNTLVTKNQLQQCTPIFASATGTANGIVLTPAPAFTTVASGSRIFFYANSTNTGATTINVSGLGAFNVLATSGLGGYNSLHGGEIQQGFVYEVIYIGPSLNQWLIINPSTTAPAYATVSLASPQALSSSSITQVHFDTVLSDVNSLYVAGNFSFTPGVIGTYSIAGTVQIPGSSPGQACALYIYKNGSPLYVIDSQEIGGVGGAAWVGSSNNIVQATSPTDYFQLFFQIAGTGFSITAPRFQMQYLGTLP